MEKLESSRVVGCRNDIIAAIDALGMAHKGRWPPMLRKHYETAIRSAELLRDSAKAANTTKE